MVSHRALAEVVGVIVVLVILAVVGFAWLNTHDQNMLAEADSRAQKAKAEQAQQDNVILAKTIADHDAANKIALDNLSKQRTEAKTSPELLALLSRLTNTPMPTQPAIVNVPANPQTGTPAQQVVQIPTSDLPHFADFATECAQCKLSLSTAQSDNLNLQQTIKNDQVALVAVEKERDDWKTAAHGGSFWHRVKHYLVVIGVTGGLTAGLTYAATR